MMRTRCENCRHRLRSEVRASGAFRFVVHFDDDRRSATYAEHVPRCPGCGTRVDKGMPGRDAGGSVREHPWAN